MDITFELIANYTYHRSTYYGTWQLDQESIAGSQSFMRQSSNEHVIINYFMSARTVPRSDTT